MRRAIIASVPSAIEVHAVPELLASRESLSHAASIRRHCHHVVGSEAQHDRFYLFPTPASLTRWPVSRQRDEVRVGPSEAHDRGIIADSTPRCTTWLSRNLDESDAVMRIPEELRHADTDMRG